MGADFDLNEARDVALRDLLGGVAAACIHLAAWRSDSVLGDAKANDAAEWIEGRLSIAAENVRALYLGGGPRWLTMADADAIRAGLTIVADKANGGGGIL